MLCTYCGRAHVAASCPTRPRLAVAALLALALALGGCSPSPEPPPTRLAKAPGELMEEPAALTPIPACEGEIECRTRYYARSRRQYSDLAQRHRGLQRWVRAGEAK